MPGIGIGIGPMFGRGGAKYDPEAQAYFDALTGTVSDAYKADVNTLVLALKASGDWDKLDRLWIHAAENQQNARISLKNPTSTAISEVNSPTWNANQGYTGNGSNMYLNSNYIPNTSGVNYQASDASLIIYSRTNVDSAANDIGVIGPSGRIAAHTLRSGNNITPYVNVTAGAGSIANTDSRGLFVANRPNGTAMQVFRNGSQLGSNLASANSPAPSISVFILGLNNNGTPITFTTRQISISGFASGQLNQSAFYTAIQAFATARGFNV